MERHFVTDKVNEEVATLFLTDGEVILHNHDSRAEDTKFEVYKHIIKDKSFPTCGQPLYGLFGYHKGECLLISFGYQKGDIMNEYYDFLPPKRMS